MLNRLIWFWRSDRLGPDIFLTHLLLFSRRLARWLCEKKFNTFGENSEFRPYAYAIFPSRISIGNNVVVRPGSMLFAVDDPAGTIVLEDDVIMGSGVHFYVSNHKFDRTDISIQYQGHHQPKEIRVKKGAWIGANAIILNGVTIGENAVVGAGAIVTKDVEPFTIVGGNPARLIRKISE